MSDKNLEAGVGADASTESVMDTGAAYGSGEPLPTAQLVDLEAIKLGQDFAASAAVRRAVTRVPVGRAPKQVFFYAHPSPGWRTATTILELAEDRESYLVMPNMREELLGEWTARILVACATRQGNYFLWSIKLHDSDGRIDSWNESALEIVDEHAARWLRVQSNRDLGCYEAFEAVRQFDEPEWPQQGFAWMVNTAFKGRVVNSPDHPVVRRLRGEI